MDKYLSTKLNIYEACDAGYITESEKVDLLFMVEAENKDNKEDDTKEKNKQVAKKIAKGIAICVALGTLLTILKTILENKSAIDKSNKKAGETLIDDLTSCKNEIMDIKLKLASYNQRIKLSDGYGLTDKGRDEVDEYMSEIKRVYSNVQRISHKANTETVGKGQRSTINNLTTQIDNIINSL